MIKANNFFFVVLLLHMFLLASTNLVGQKSNSYEFIEPNISISYDSNTFKIKNRYSGSESYDFKFCKDTANKVNIYIKADHPIEFPPKKTQDSLMLLGLEEVKNTENDSFAIVNFDKQVRNINGFSCLGFVGYDKINKRYGTIISCYHLSANDNTVIEFMSFGRNNLSIDYDILINFLSGFKVYKKIEIAKEEKLIKSKYSVLTTPTKKIIDNFQYRPKTYIGIVKTKQKLVHTIKEVRLINSFGKEIFSPATDGTVSIICNDEEKGRLTKKGELVLLNSFGKMVKIPFTFSYINNGVK